MIKPRLDFLLSYQKDKWNRFDYKGNQMKSKRWIVEYDDGSLRIFITKEPVSRQEAEAELGKELGTRKVVSLSYSHAQNLDEEQEIVAGMRTVQNFEYSHNFIARVFTLGDINGMVYESDDDGDNDTYFNLSVQEFDRLRDAFEKVGVQDEEWELLDCLARDIVSDRKS